MPLNFLVFNFIHSLAGRWDILDRAGVFFAKDAIYLAALAFIFFFIFGIRAARSRATFFAQSALAIIISLGIILETARALFYLARPFEALEFAPLVYGPQASSFPSGHAIFVFTLSALVFSRHKKLGIALFALSVAVGIARVFAGVHWPLDIVGGAIFGIGSALLARRLVQDEK